MNRKTFNPSRRQLLRGGCATIALPFLESLAPLAATAAAAAPTGPRPRMLFTYFACGVCNEEWYPAQTGKAYEFSPSLEPLAPFRDELSVLSGLSHPFNDFGHAAADSWLTADKCNDGNSISVDQIAARHLGDDVRFPSLQLSMRSGTGKVARTYTLSYSEKGEPIPAQADPENIFKRLFVAPDAKSMAEAENRLRTRRSILDGLRERVADLRRDLGSADSQRLVEYLDAIRDVERSIAREEIWLRKPKPEVSRAVLEGRDFHKQHVEILSDLIFLAFKSNSTRVISYLSSIEGTRAHGWSHHGGRAEPLAKLAGSDREQVALFARLLAKLKEAPEAGGSMLDHTMILFGSGMNNGLGFKNGSGDHGVTKLPTLLAGGGAYGIRHGQHLMFPDDKTPLAQVFVTMLERAGVADPRFKGVDAGLAGV